MVWFGIAIGVLVVASIALVLSARSTPSLLPEGTPEGTVQRFLMALEDKDYPKAFSYVSQIDERGNKITYQDWLRMVPFPASSSQTTWKATLSTTTVTGRQATVKVVVDVFRPGGPFENPVRSQGVLFQLTQVDSSWLIVSPPGLYWLY